MSTTRIHSSGTMAPQVTLLPSGTRRPSSWGDTPVLQIVRNRWHALGMEPGGNEVKWWVGVGFLALIGWMSATLINFEPSATRSLPQYLAHASLELVALVAGLALGAGFRLATPQGRRYLSLGTLAVALVFLGGVLVQGRSINGATRWYDLGPFAFQPLELAKLGIILTAAWYFAPLKPRPEGWQVTVSMIMAMTMGVMLGLIVAQPNISGAFLIFSMLFLLSWWTSQVPRRLLLLVAFMACIGATGFIAFDAERSQRIHAVTAAQSDNLDISEETYQLRQARFAIARGGWLGVGPGRSEVKHTLPASESDFIFAILVEEYGMVGSLAILLLLFGAVASALHFSACCPDRFMQFVGFGIAIHWSLQILLSLQVNLGGVTTGVPLPFFSKGGSASLVIGVEIALIALIASLIDRRRRDVALRRVSVD